MPAPISIANARTLAEVRAAGVEADYRHTRVRTYLRAMENNHRARRQYSHLWAAGYERFGDIFEETFRSLPTHRPKTVDFVKALPDPWMVTGHLSTELSEEWFLVWDRTLGTDRLRLLNLLNDPLPSRTREILTWLGKKRLSVPGTFFAKEETQTNTLNWPNVFGYNLAEFGYTNRPTHAVTENDLYALMDAGTKLPLEVGVDSIQEKLARFRGDYTDEKRALSQTWFRYPSLSAEDAERYPLTASFIAWGKSGPVDALGSIDPAKFEVILADAESLPLSALRARLAYCLEDVNDLYGGPLSPSGQMMWDAALAYSTVPETRFRDAARGWHSTEEVELIVSWMSKHIRPSTDQWSGWLPWVLSPEDGSAWHEPKYQDADLSVLCDIIRAGATWQELYDVLAQGLVFHEAVEVFVNGVPIEYVLATRDTA